jgi:hypothetical protein
VACGWHNPLGTVLGFGHWQHMGLQAACVFSHVICGVLCALCWFKQVHGALLPVIWASMLCAARVAVLLFTKWALILRLSCTTCCYSQVPGIDVASFAKVQLARYCTSVWPGSSLNCVSIVSVLLMCCHTLKEYGSTLWLPGRASSTLFYVGKG